MDVEVFREHCLTLKGTTEDIKWGEHLCFMVAEKIYVIFSLDEGSLTFKVDPANFDELTARHGIAQAAHFAKRQWVTLENMEVMPSQELFDRIGQSRQLVINKLPKKVQQTLQ